MYSDEKCPETQLIQQFCNICPYLLTYRPILHIFPRLKLGNMTSIKTKWFLIVIN